MQTASTRPHPNVGDKERILSALAGSLLFYATARKHTINTLLLAGGGYLLYRAVTGRCPVREAFAHRLEHAGGDMKVRTHVVVARPRHEVYEHWRRFGNLPDFMRHLESVDELDDRTAAWRLKMPGGAGEVRWETTIVKDEKDVEISWHAVPGSVIRNTGKINFSDTPGKGTRVDVMIAYGIPRGAIGERMVQLLTPGFRRRVEQDIAQFREYTEIEAIYKTDGHAY